MTKYQNYGIKLYIPLEDLNKYISERIDEAYQDLTFIPSKVEVNELDFGIEINLLSVNPIKSDGRRYKLELDKLSKERTTMNEWISVKDRLPRPFVDVLVLRNEEIKIDYYTEDGWFAHDFKGKRATHWMPLPAPPAEENKLTLVDNNKMLWVNKKHFRCSCGGNVFSEYKTGDGKRIFECHGCGSKYEGE